MDFFRAIVQPDKLPLWLIPLGLAVIIRLLKQFIHHPMLVAIFCLLIPAGFYIILFSLGLDLEYARQMHWIPSMPKISNQDIPFVKLWQKIHFEKIDFDALLMTLPTSLSLVMFSILQIGINVCLIYTFILLFISNDTILASCSCDDFEIGWSVSNQPRAYHSRCQQLCFRIVYVSSKLFGLRKYCLVYENRA